MWAAALAAAGPAQLLWAEGDEPRSACDELGVAVIGVRGRGNSHLRFFSDRRDTRVLYVCDVDAQVGATRVAQVAKRQGGPAPLWVADLRRALDDPRVDVVSIATPHHWHAVAASWAMQAGKDVYLEKPVSHNVQEGRALVETARRLERICQAGMQARSLPAARAAVEFVRGGGIGRVQSARALCYRQRAPLGPRGRYPVPPQVDYDLWLGPATPAPLTRAHFHHDWHWQWPYGNGELGHQGFQPLDICRWGLGEMAICQSVWTWGGRFGQRDAAHVMNTQVVQYQFSDTSIVVETRALPSAPYHGVQVGVVFEGSDGRVVLNRLDRGTAFDAAGRPIRQFRGGGSQWHFANFLRAVRRRSCAELTADIEEGHITSALVHLANISYRLGRRLPLAEATAQLPSGPDGQLLTNAVERMYDHLRAQDIDMRTASLRCGARLVCDPATERIVNHAPANRFLTRDYRSPYQMPATGSA